MRGSFPFARSEARAALPMAIAFAFALSCGGKVIFETSGAGAGGASSGSVSTNASVTTTKGSGMTCLTTATIGTGDFGPGTVKATKCFSPQDGNSCPAPSGAASFLTPDACHVIASVDDECASSLCCYDVTEQLECKGG